MQAHSVSETSSNGSSSIQLSICPNSPPNGKTVAFVGFPTVVLEACWNRVEPQKLWLPHCRPILDAKDSVRYCLHCQVTQQQFRGDEGSGWLVHPLSKVLCIYNFCNKGQSPLPQEFFFHVSASVHWKTIEKTYTFSFFARTTPQGPAEPLRIDEPMWIDIVHFFIVGQNHPIWLLEHIFPDVFFSTTNQLLLDPKLSCFKPIEMNESQEVSTKNHIQSSTSKVFSTLN